MRDDFGLPGDAFGPGPWAGEPGRVEWRHNGMPCLARRNSMGVWCGYAAVPPGHPLHGGLTYADGCDGAEGEGICHVPEPGEPGDVWWFGFDCNHYHDQAPGMLDVVVPFEGAVYRTIEYARQETERLADQLAALS